MGCSIRGCGRDHTTVATFQRTGTTKKIAIRYYLCQKCADAVTSAITGAI